MDFNSFIEHINDIKNRPLGGLASQFKMAPEMRLQFTDTDIEKRNPKESAVLALFYPDQTHRTRLLLMERAAYQGVHASQISFPGGKKDRNDIDLQATALRETEEETGVLQKKIHVVRQITKTYIPPSNFIVTPFIALIENTPVFRTNHEVASLIHLPLNELLDEQTVTVKNLSTSYMKNIDVPCFRFGRNIVWGATAMMLSEIKDLLNPVYHNLL